MAVALGIVIAAIAADFISEALDAAQCVTNPCYGKARRRY